MGPARTDTHVLVEHLPCGTVVNGCRVDGYTRAVRAYCLNCEVGSQPPVGPWLRVRFLMRGQGYPWRILSGGEVVTWWRAA